MAVGDAGLAEDGVRSAVAVEIIESAAIFVVRSGSRALVLAAAAGVEGPALDGLVAAVRDPSHPINRTLTDAGPTFDVAPTRPGGPALRSHLPLVAAGAGDRRVVGVLAVAHDRPLAAGERATLQRVADAAATAISRGSG